MPRLGTSSAAALGAARVAVDNDAPATIDDARDGGTFVLRGRPTPLGSAALRSSLGDTTCPF